MYLDVERIRGRQQSRRAREAHCTPAFSLESIMHARNSLAICLVVSLAGCATSHDLSCDAPTAAASLRVKLVESTVSAERRATAALSDSELAKHVQLREIITAPSATATTLDCQAVLVISSATPASPGQNEVPAPDTVVPLKYQVFLADESSPGARLTAPTSKEVLAITLGLNAVYRAHIDASKEPRP